MTAKSAAGLAEIKRITAPCYARAAIFVKINERFKPANQLQAIAGLFFAKKWIVWYNKYKLD
ncbi:MAG: hypothetical protein PHT51_01200 [Patescibacteria group bacterium]|nr:hypothetical protein [Patescibacteria group bacterium]MDD4610490.1 hypothetical protein [Patescibacteria group bacterium]